jgi:hypothetical protein
VRLRRLASAFLTLALAAGSLNLLRAQAPATTPEQTPAPGKTPQPPSAQPDAPQPSLPGGTILFSRDANSPGPSPNSPPAGLQQPATLDQNDPLAVTDAERNALTFTAYDLDLHLTPASAAMSARAALTVKNLGTAPLSRLVLQITSSMHWDAFSIAGAPLKFAVRLVDTDADHTGQAQEAVVTLPISMRLAPGASIAVTALYSGAIPPSAARLERIGAPADQALAADWDAIATSGTALRGFGNVLWYPVAAPPLFLGDGARLFQAVGSARLRESAAAVRLRLAIEYLGDPPDAAFFCGQRQQLKAISDNSNLPEADAPGIATAVFAPHPLGFRTLDLFVTGHPPSETGTAANPGLISAVTDHYDALPAYSAAAALVEPMLVDWFGPGVQAALTMLDHPGQPFEDDALLVRPMRAADPATLAPALAHSLTHAWIHSAHPWIDEGLAEFMALVWTERTHGRAAALDALQDAAPALALAEPEVPISAEDRPALPPGASSSSPASSTDDTPQSNSLPTPTPSVSVAGVSLAAATGDIFYRTKAAAVWWMLRAIVGDEALKHALQAYRSDARLDLDPEGLERAVEKSSGKVLRWFFNDWVYRDRGLPDLTIAAVTPSQLESRAGLPAGWLVAVDVRNDGYAAAEVPVTVRSGNAAQTQRLRIPGRSSASTRIVFAGRPDQVQVNDGGVPETRTSIHTRDLVLPGH